VADLPFALDSPLASRLEAALDVEGKLARALVDLGSLAGRDVALLDAGAGWLAGRLREDGVAGLPLPLTEPLRLDVADGSLDAILSRWTGFRGVDPAALTEVDRALRPGGRLLVVHDYGRDDVCSLREGSSPEYTTWSRRDGPFLRGGFRIRVLHCHWTFDSLDEARGFLAEAFGDGGRALAAGLGRPRLRWNVAVYHRTRPAA
jgi:SAM-dependent methyltransferase